MLSSDADDSLSFSITIRHVDGSVTNYGSSKRDAVFGVSPGQLLSDSLNFLASFARPPAAGVAHATTAKKSIFSR